MSASDRTRRRRGDGETGRRGDGALAGSLHLAEANRTSTACWLVAWIQAEPQDTTSSETNMKSKFLLHGVHSLVHTELGYTELSQKPHCLMANLR